MYIPNSFDNVFDKLSAIFSKSVFERFLRSQALYISSGLIFFVKKCSLNDSLLLYKSLSVSSIVSFNIVSLYPWCLASSTSLRHECVYSDVFKSRRLTTKFVSNSNSTLDSILGDEYSI